jgi:hypothetical protein
MHERTTTKEWMHDNRYMEESESTDEDAIEYFVDKYFAPNYLVKQVAKKHKANAVKVSRALEIMGFRRKEDRKDE